MDLRNASFCAACARLGIGTPTVTQVVFPYLRRAYPALEFKPPLSSFSDAEYEVFMGIVREMPQELHDRISRFEDHVRFIVD